MDYEKKYKDALSRAKGMWEQGMMPERIEYIFPELKESEDEKIRKEIIFFFEQEIPQCSIEEHKEYMRKWISWLEKQGEQKETDYNEELEKCKANPLYFFDVGYKELNLNTAKCEYCGTVFEYNSSDLEEEEDRDMRGYHYYYYAKCPKCGNRIFVKSLI